MTSYCSTISETTLDVYINSSDHTTVKTGTKFQLNVSKISLYISYCCCLIKRFMSKHAHKNIDKNN